MATRWCALRARPVRGTRYQPAGPVLVYLSQSRPTAERLPTPWMGGSTIPVHRDHCQAGRVAKPRAVLVVDDQAQFRLAARALLRRLEEFEFAGEATNGAEAIHLVERIRPELVLMDINMPVVDGIEATRRIAATHPDTAVILCSTYDATDLPPAVSDCGAIGYISKERLGVSTLYELWAGRGTGVFAAR
jgi:two-component system, NarL family, invasion response regulator UvrY